ncbi:MAG: histidine kinase dimerization/phospho-acceptor domain-containing protein, partial [Myxococcota bacterium]
MSVRLRLAVALVGVALGVVLVFALVARQGLETRARERLAASLETSARLAHGLLGDTGLAPAEREVLQARVAGVARDVGVRLTVIDRAGVVVADSEVPAPGLAALENHASRPELAAALAGRVGVHERISGTVRRPLLYVAIPVEGGALRVATNAARVEAEAAALWRALAGAVAVGLALAGLLAGAIATFLSRRVSELLGVLRGIAAGDLSRRLPWRSGDQRGAIAAAIDEMSEQLRRRLAEARDEQERLTAVLQGMVEGVLVLDRAGRVILANPRLRELFGAWGAVEGRPPIEVIRRADVDVALAEAAESREPVVREIRLGTDGGRHLEMHAVRFPSEGERLGTVAVFHDVTEIRRLEGVRRDFVANVSHELRTPLTAIRGYAETLRGDLSPEQRRQFLDVILRHAERLNSLIGDLLDLSRIEGGTRDFSLEPVDVVAMARGLLQDLKPRLDARELRADVRATQAPRALADRRALEQVLLNLLDNAVKYSDPGGEIEVAVSEAAGGGVRIEVSDTGIGIPEADRARIFERFYRVDKARRSCDEFVTAPAGPGGQSRAAGRRTVKTLPPSVLAVTKTSPSCAWTR